MITRQTLNLYKHWLKQNLAFRKEHPGVIYDVQYDSFVSDPIGTVRGIYTHYNLSWSEANETTLKAHIEDHPKNKHGRHRYSLADFGLTKEQVTDQLQPYIDQFEF